MSEIRRISEPVISPVFMKLIARSVPTRYVWRLVKFYKYLRSPLQYFIRRNAARKILQSPLEKRIDPGLGYLAFERDFEPKIGAAIDACRTIFHRQEESGELIERQTAFSKGDFLVDILSESDLERYPEITELGVSDSFLRIASDYLGTLPRLRYLALWWSHESDDLNSSQLFHTDREDRRSLKVFVNVEPVSQDNGPFTLFTADQTEEVLRKLGNEYRHPFVGALGKIDDDTIFSVVDRREAKTLTGESGDGAFVDTCNCLHFGSRCKEGRRLVLVFMYNGFYNVTETRPKIFDISRFAVDRFRRLALGAG